MIHLNPTEARVLGVLVEKAHTSSGYPMSLNAVTDGCNQKSNRNPVVNFDEDRVLAALDSLRAKQLVLFADMLGSRVTKFRHNTREVLGASENELLVLVELLLRGPQTAAELRLHASRMRPVESVDAVHEALRTLIERPEPFAQRIPGGRAERFVQLLCPDLHSLAQPAGSTGILPASGMGVSPAVSPDQQIQPGPGPDVTDRLAKLESQVADLRRIIERLADALGASDILQ
jgi:uncharacterized protein YceH (UPF0502 family)